MSYSPTDALSMNVILTAASNTFSFDCVEASYQARMHGSYVIRALVASDVNDFAFQAAASNIQLGMWSKISVQSERFGSLVFQGKVDSITGSDKYANGQELLWIECVPECHELFINVRSGIYLGGSVLDIIKRSVVGQFNALAYQNTAVTQSLSQNASAYYPLQNSITQFGESDLAFALRNMAEYGIWATLRQDYTGNSGITLLLGDHNGALNEIGTVTVLSNINHEGAGLFNLELSNHHLADSVRAIYFDETQNQYLMDTATIGTGTGENIDHHCLGNLLTQTQVNNIAETVKSSIQVQHQKLTASFQGLNLQPGDMIEVPINDSNTPFVIFAIDYEFAKGDDERAASAQHSQKHTLTAYALVDESGNSITYRAPIWIKNTSSSCGRSASVACRTGAAQDPGQFTREYPNYNYQGILSGCYGMATGAIVVPDSLGNIPVQFPYNYTEVCGNTPARYTRLISLSNEGGITGRTFPIYQDTELQVTFANGNMDYPLIKGAAANANTGHVHSSTVQQRAHYALPQGQYTTYSNVPGDHNFVAMGAQHSEGQNRSFMMLSNHQDPNNPGSKKLDQQMITNQSHEQVVSGDSHKFHAGNQNFVNGQTQPLPITYIQFVIGDQTNIQNPTSAPMLDDYLAGISADITYTHQSGRENTASGATLLTGKVYAITQNLAQTADATVPIDVTQVQISLIHNGKNGTDKTVAVNIIAQNSTPIFPTNTITVTASQWQQNKTTDNAGNIYYIVNLNLLAPAMIFNFRQDLWLKNKQLTGDGLAVYQALQPYFQEESYTTRPRVAPLTDSELNFFATMGNNVTLFIHGYNVGFGTWPSYYVNAAADAKDGLQPANTLFPSGSSNLYQDDTFMQTKYGSAYNPKAMFPDGNGNIDNKAKVSALIGTEAHLWLMSMENNLNVAAGFDGKDYSKYTRLIGINWQGNPNNAADYMVATGTTIFPAEQAFALIQQLNAKGIKINIMAHSLGNDVLMHILDLCGTAGVQVNQAFLWESAIPNTAFGANQNSQILPFALPNPSNKNQPQNIPYQYNYPHAQQGAGKATILFSNEDTILGPIPKDATAWNVLKNTYQDPGAGLSFAIPATAIATADDIPHTGIHDPLASIYHIANLFVYPLSYFTNGIEGALDAYYQLWIAHYSQWQDDNGNMANFASTLETQRSVMASKYPRLFDLLSDLFSGVDSNNTNITNSYSDLTDKEKVTATAVDALHLIPLFGTGGIATGDASTPESEHAKDVATIILSGLLTPKAQPPIAMGYEGATSIPSGYSQSAQKDPSGADLCVDHSAMLFPTPQFMEYIYKGVLFGGSTGFETFGKWK